MANEQNNTKKYASDATIQSMVNKIKSDFATKDEVANDYLPKAGGTVTGTTVFNKVQDAVADAYNAPAVVIGGDPSQAHLELDNNEIQAKGSETTPGNLFLNSNGGTVHVGFGGLKVDAEGVIIPEGALSSSVGTAETPFNKEYSRYYYIYGAENADYGSLRVSTTGTTSEAGVTTLELGNTKAIGTAHNAKGRIIMRGNGTSFTNIVANPDRTSGSNEVYLPTGRGTLALEETSTKAVVTTKAQYDALTPEEYNANALYMITDEEDENFVTSDKVYTKEEVDAAIADTAVTMVADGALKYTLYQGSEDNATTIGTIDIPKDMVVESGEVVTDPTIDGTQTTGTYIKLQLANVDEPLYINVGTLVDIYTAQEGATQVQVTINSSTREISAEIVSGSIGTNELADNAVTTAKIADSNVTTAKIADGNVTTAKLSTELQTAITQIDANTGKLTNIEDYADVNIIEAITVNGSALTPDDNKAVNITIPTGLLADKDTITESDLDAALATKIDNKANAGEVYTSSQIDALLQSISGTDDHEHASTKITLADVNSSLSEDEKIGDTLDVGLLNIISLINAKADGVETSNALDLKAEISALNILETTLKTYVDEAVAKKSAVQIITWEDED